MPLTSTLKSQVAAWPVWPATSTTMLSDQPPPAALPGNWTDLGAALLACSWMKPMPAWMADAFCTPGPVHCAAAADWPVAPSNTAVWQLYRPTQPLNDATRSRPGRYATPLLTSVAQALVKPPGGVTLAWLLPAWALAPDSAASKLISTRAGCRVGGRCLMNCRVMGNLRW